MVSTSDVILKYVSPGLGVIMGNLMFAAPLRDCHKAVRAGKGLGTLNPIPWAFCAGNCFGWITYGILKQDLFIFFANAPGMLMAVWLNLQAVKLQYDSFRSQETRKSIIQALEHEISTSSEVFLLDNSAPSSVLSRIVYKVTAPAMNAPALHDYIVMLNAVVWLAVVAIISYGTAFTSTTREYIVGITVNLNLVIFYASPLFVIWTVLQQRNSISIHIPTMVTNTLNGSFWAAYGIAILDPFIAVPNGLGASLGGIQILLCLLFPRRAEADESPELITGASPTEPLPVMEVAPTALVSN